MIRGCWCSKSSLAKAAGAEVGLQPRNENWHAAVARSTFSSQNVQNTSAFWSSDPEKKHAAVARSTFACQNVQNTSWGRFLKFGCRKIARRCGAKHICKSKFLTFRYPKMARRCGAKHICQSKCAKHLRFGTLLDLRMWKRSQTEEIYR